MDYITDEDRRNYQPMTPLESFMTTTATIGILGFAAMSAILSGSSKEDRLLNDYLARQTVAVYSQIYEPKDALDDSELILLLRNTGHSQDESIDLIDVVRENPARFLILNHSDEEILRAYKVFADL